MGTLNRFECNIFDITIDISFANLYIKLVKFVVNHIGVPYAFL
jgi:hypothetical protein